MTSRLDSSTTYLSVRALSKTFGGQHALRGANLDVAVGEIHALVGQNGSGKSTLIKTLAGIYHPEGDCHIDVSGAPLTTGNPLASHAAGLRFIHQDLGLIGSMSVIDNLELGSPTSRLWLTRSAMRSNARQQLAAHGLRVDPTSPIDRLSRSEQSMLAIVRAIRDLPDGRGLLVLDEPTAALPPREVDRLLADLRALRDRGLSILYVTHRLDEVLAVSDRVTGLRDGQNVATYQTSQLDHGSLIELIVGAQPDTKKQASPTTGQEHGRSSATLSVRRLSGPRLNDVSFDAHGGEILGVTGLLGSGFENVLACVFGAIQPTAGTVSLDSETVALGACARAVRAGLGYVPGDRDRIGTITQWSVARNLTLTQIPTRKRLPILDPRAERRAVADWIKRLDVALSDPDQPLWTLSGGNRQRVAVARWLWRGSRVLLLDEPTSGVDVAGKDRIHDQLRQAASTGHVVVVASSDYEELAALCNRVLIMRTGRITQQLAAPHLSADELFAASTGQTRDSADSYKHRTPNRASR